MTRAPRRRDAGGGRPGFALPAASAPLLLFLALPLVALVAWSSPGEVLDNLRRPEVGQAIALSLTTSGTATPLVVALGTPLAYLLARREFPGRPILEALVDLPMVLPPAVAGIALLLAFGRRGLVGAPLTGLGVEIAFTAAAVVLAQVFT